MPGLYIGSTKGYSGKNLIVLGMGLWLQARGLSVGYLKPVGAMPTPEGDVMGDEDALFVQRALNQQADPETLTPVVVTRDFKVQAFSGQTEGLRERIAQAYAHISADKDVTLVAGSGSMYSGRYCGVDGVSLVHDLDLKAVVIDRYDGDLRYDDLLVLGEKLGERLAGTVFNDLPPEAEPEVELLTPFLASRGVPVLGSLPRDPLLGSISVADLAEKLGGRIVSAHARTDRVVERFLIGTMQVENFLTHFKKRRGAAVEGEAPCLILTGNLYPNEIILTRSEVLETPLIMVRDDTFSIAKKMESILARHKLRDGGKIERGQALVAERLRMPDLIARLGLKAD